MKKLLSSMLFILIVTSSIAQVTNVASKSFGTITDLRVQAGTDNVQVLLQGLVTAGDSNGGIYAWVATNTDTDDGFITIKVTNVTTGRWKRMSNENTIKGNVTFSATVLNSTYVVNHGLPFTPLHVYIQPRSANAAVPSWVSTITSTSFTVNFASVPILGTNNITIDYLVIKQ